MERFKIAHEIFSIEKVYQATTEDVFNAWASAEAKANWFFGPQDWTLLQRELDFRVGGTEILHGRFASGLESLYRAQFYLIEPKEQLVFTYDMVMNGKLFSVSIASVEIESVSSQESKLKFTEQVAFLGDVEGGAGVASRKEGTQLLLNRLSDYVER